MLLSCRILINRDVILTALLTNLMKSLLLRHNTVNLFSKWFTYLFNYTRINTIILRMNRNISAIYWHSLNVVNAKVHWTNVKKQNEVALNQETTVLSMQMISSQTLLTGLHNNKSQTLHILGNWKIIWELETSAHTLVIRVACRYFLSFIVQLDKIHQRAKCFCNSQSYWKQCLRPLRRWRPLLILKKKEQNLSYNVCFSVILVLWNQHKSCQFSSSRI